MLGRVSFNSWLLFSCFFLVCKFYKSGLDIITDFEHRQCVIWGFLVFSFIVLAFIRNFSLNLKSYCHLHFLALFPDLEMIKFWSVNYICQFCQLCFYFGHIRNFGQYLYLNVFSKHGIGPTCPVSVLLYCSYCTQNCIFCTFWSPKTLVLCEKFFKIFLYFAQKTTKLIAEKVP